MKTGMPQLPGRSFLLIGGTAVIFLVFLLLFNYKSFRAARQLEDNIAEIENSLRIQQKLYPTYLTLKKKEVEKKITTLPFPEKKPLPIDSIDGIPSMIKDIALKSGGLDVLSVIPDVNQRNEGARHISVDINITGEFHFFRNFMSGIGGLACLEKMESVRIENVQDKNTLFMKIWLSVE